MDNENKEKFIEGQFQGKVLEKLDVIEKALFTKVDRSEFLPVKSIAYGMVGLIVVAVLTAILANVVKAIVK